MPSPKPRPAALRLMEGRGNGRDSGGRKVKDTPTFRRLPPKKPADLSERAAEHWDLLIAELSRLQLVKGTDAGSLAMACETYSRWHHAKSQRIQNGMLATNSQGQVTAPWVGIEERAAKDYRAWCSEFGLTPSAEMALGRVIENDDKDNPFAS